MLHDETVSTHDLYSDANNGSFGLPDDPAMEQEIAALEQEMAQAFGWNEQPSEDEISAMNDAAPAFRWEAFASLTVPTPITACPVVIDMAKYEYDRAVG